MARSKKSKEKPDTNIKAAWIGVAGTMVATLITIYFSFTPSQPLPLPSGGSQNIENQTINNYYGANPKEVEKLKKELLLKNAMVENLLRQVNNKNIPAENRTKEFKALVEKHQQLIKTLAQYEHDPELAEKVSKALENGELDKAEKLLEDANKKDEAVIEQLQQRQQQVADRTFNLAQISELKLETEVALQRYKKVTQLDPENLRAWQQQAKLSKKLGITQGALHAWQQLQFYAQQKQEPRWEAIGLSGEGNILAIRGDGKPALDKYTQVHKFFIKQLKRDPNNSDWQRDLSVSYNKIGDMHQANGEGKQALTAYQDSLKIAEALTKREIGNATYP